MCTVSFVVSNDKTIITSNRDEKVNRSSAIEPRNYLVNNKNLIFPKDPKAGGTWFAIDESGTTMVLLNGANDKHSIKSFYRKSRGLIVLDMISSFSPKDFWQDINLENIEPFTLVLFQDKELFQLQWDGINKGSISLDTEKNHIWSSSTLYSVDIRVLRANWFYTFLDAKIEVNETELYHFHRYTESENKEYGLVINRDNMMKTLGITQAVIEKNKVVFSYYDLLQQKEFVNSFITI